MTIYTFIWNSKREKVKRNVCIKSKREGGLGMVDLILKANSLRLSWIYSASQKKRNREVSMFYHNLITTIINK